MAHIEERETGAGKRYDVRYRDPDGKHRRRSFAKIGLARQFATTVEADLIRGAYIDVSAGKRTFRSYADAWLKVQTFDPSTRQAVEVRLSKHTYPVLGGLALRTIKPSTIQAWLRGLDVLAPSYRQVIFANVSTILSAAVDDELIAKNPCAAGSVRRPRTTARKVVPWEAEAVRAVTAALPDRYQILATLGAGLGMRQGEIFALSTEDVDWLRGSVEVRRQVKMFSGRLVFALPKGRKTRMVPLPESVKDALAAYLVQFPARRVVLPWQEVGGEPVTVPLILSTRESKATNRSYFNQHVWKPALEAAGVAATRDNGCHALRHFYASVLLDAGESIKAVSEYLGHADAGFTLRTYTHLMPSSAERTRKAIDGVLAPIEEAARMAHG